MVEVKASLRRVKHLPDMYLISILDVNNILELNKLSELDDDLDALERVDDFIKKLSAHCDIKISRVKFDKFGDIITLLYHMPHGVIEITLADVAEFEVFISDKTTANIFKSNLSKFFKVHIDEENQFKDIFIDSIQIYKKDNELVSHLVDEKTISKIFAKSVHILFLSCILVSVFESVKFVFAELFAETLKLSGLTYALILTVTIALTFRPVEKFTNGIVSKIIFQKKRKT